MCRLVLCATFVFSGFVKLADPMGMVYKLHAYAVALNLPYSSSALLLEFFAVAFGLVEFVLGIYLFLGVRRKLTNAAVLILTAFFHGSNRLDLLRESRSRLRLFWRCHDAHQRADAR